MPIYEYRCPDCGTQFEEIRSSRDTSDVECPTCGAKKAERLLSGFAVGGGSGSSKSSGGSSCGSSGSGFS